MLFRTTITLALALSPAPLLAQGVVQPVGVSDADALAEQVRRLGANPLDLDALLTAAELSLRLDDLSAAGSFLARADKIAPGGARGQAVRGAILVRSERPGEALAQFARAEAMGVAPARFAADRGLAYDLVGDQPRAQQQYRLALREGGGDDETRRRFALSLGISGKQREALDELAPLVRRNDRAAWRTRAFVLAMGGDAAEASRIASTMMPPGSAQGLKAFFDELPRLPAIDRAFAVHFGEVRPTPSRLADARLAPQLAPLPAEPAPVQVAAVAVPVATPPRERGKRKPEKLKAGRVALATEPAPTVVAALEVPSQPPAYQAPAYQPSTYTPQRPSVAAIADRPLTPAEQASLAAATLKPSQRRRARPTPAPVAVATTSVVPRALPPVTLAATVPVPRPIVPSTAPAVTPPAATPVASSLGIAPPSVAVTAPAVPFAPIETTPAPAPVAVVAAPPVAISTPLAALVTPTRPVTVAPAPRPSRLPRAKADDILAKIVANLSIPASELGVDKAAPGGKASRAADKLTATRKPVPDKVAEPPVDRKAEARKALADKKAAAEKKALADKDAAEKKAARGEPSRIWVQVAGGANEGDLTKAWKSAQGKAPALAGRQGYTTPLRATNRVLTGPFKTDAEARAYVNQLAKSGVSAFSFTSDAGQKVSKLGSK